jgi:hypothetical protein
VCSKSFWIRPKPTTAWIDFALYNYLKLILLVLAYVLSPPALGIKTLSSLDLEVSLVAFPAKRGIRQREIPSPIIFNIVVDAG